MSEVDKVKKFLKSKKGYLKTGNTRLSKILNVDINSVKKAKNALKKDLMCDIINPKYQPSFLRPNYDPNNVLFIPDLHAPFIKKGVLEFIKDSQIKYNCGTVLFAGDVIDGHAWSYHEHDPDGMSVGDELKAAKEQLKEWYEAFPEAIILMGNHDLLIQRKARTIGLSKHFIKDFGSVIEAPKTWKFDLEHIKDNVLYKHGNVGDAFKVAKESRMSTCQGHFHAKTFVQWSVSEKDSIFGLQVGWGADRHKYAFDYGKSFSNKPIISCGLVLEKGRLPIVKLMDL
jgi:hypothetical protein